MLSRGLTICKSLQKLNSKSLSVSAIRNSSAWVYRTGPKPANKMVVLTAEIVGATMWWWILWHLFTEPEHITGEFPYPNPSEWTDDELGIPK